MTSKYKIQTPRMIWQNCKEGVHSLCQNKNAHSLGLSYLKRLQFHTMFDVYGHFVDWILIFLQTLYTNIYPANNIYIYVITKRNKWENFLIYFIYFSSYPYINKTFCKGTFYNHFSWDVSEFLYKFSILWNMIYSIFSCWKSILLCQLPLMLGGKNTPLRILCWQYFKNITVRYINMYSHKCGQLRDLIMALHMR